MIIDYSNPTYLERTAVHEAGHAVVSTLSPLLPAVQTLSLNPGGGGLCELHTERGPEGSKLADVISQGIRVCVSGPLAEDVAFGAKGRGPVDLQDPDRDEAKALRLGEMLREQLVADFLRSSSSRYDAKAERDLTRTALARFGGAIAGAEFLLRGRWGAVDLVARRLLECGSLPGEFVRQLIDAAPERTKPSATIEADIALMAKAGAADPALGAALVKALGAAA